MQEDGEPPLCGIALLEWSGAKARGKGGPWEVMPRVLLGNKQHAAALGKLQARGVTHVLNVGAGQCPFPDTFAYCKLHIEDHADADLGAVLEEGTAFIAQALENPHTVVLVHCAGGFSRSPSLLIAYCVAHRGLTVEQSLALLRDSRPCVAPNHGFLKHLARWERKHKH